MTQKHTPAFNKVLVFLKKETQTIHPSTSFIDDREPPVSSSVKEGLIHVSQPLNLPELGGTSPYSSESVSPFLGDQLFNQLKAANSNFITIGEEV